MPWIKSKEKDLKIRGLFGEKRKGTRMNKRKKGAAYEEIAASYLENYGIHIIKRNYRIRQGEVDLIGEDASHLIFFEVKYRKNNGYGAPYLAVSEGKKRKISTVSRHYLWYFPTNKQVRYDVVCICDTHIQWYKNAFDYRGNW